MPKAANHDASFFEHPAEIAAVRKARREPLPEGRGLGRKDSRVRPDSDMMKAQMRGRRILRMGKQLAGAQSEVVGPAKFGRDGVSRLLRRLEALEHAGERNRWAYGIFGELADELAFTGVEAPGCYWAEVDTLADADDADRRIPPSMQELAARSEAIARN